LRPPLSTLFPYTTLFRSTFFSIPSIILPLTAGRWGFCFENFPFYTKVSPIISHLHFRSSRFSMLTLQSGNVIGCRGKYSKDNFRSEEHTSELQSRFDLVC